MLKKGSLRWGKNCRGYFLLSLSTISASGIYGKCELPTAYKSLYYYTVFLTKPEKTADNFYLVLTKNNHSLYGGQCRLRKNCEPIIRFENYNAAHDSLSSQRSFVHYRDFSDAINSDQPAHNVRIRAGDRYITLTKITAREFRNGLAGHVLNTIVQAGR